ncbi:MAG TPA: glycosyltransferase, partial [Candidatus Angelobacter sp.]|nr:glycosyltransferase [Candidatus Angelobacter sp.]
MLIAAGVLTLLIWGYLLLGRGGFWRIQTAVPPSVTKEVPARIAVVIPARNEADVVGRTVISLLRQSGANSIHIFLVDDGSTDGTAQAAREAAAAIDCAEMLTVVEGHPLAAGWSGKMWAVQQGIELAAKTSPDFFLLTDADIEHAPDSLTALVSIAHAGPYDLASFMVKLYCESPAEKLLIPAFVYFFFKLYPPALIANPRNATASAAGGCILIRPAALAQAGGIAAIRSEVIDDCALALRVKRSGGRLWLGASATTRSTRPYGSFSEIGRMISRSAFNQLHHSVLLLIASMVGMVITYLLPPALVLFSHRPLPTILGTAAWFLMTLSYIPVLRLYRLNLLWALALPLTAV